MHQRLPVLAMYAGSVPEAAIESGLFYRFEKISLDEGGGDQRLALCGRQVVILTAQDDVSVARALRDAQLMADAGAASVGLALAGDGDVVDAVERGLRAGIARALPLPGGTRRAVAPHLGRVGGAALWLRLRSFIARLLAEPASTIDVLALWVLHTWLIEAAGPFFVSPRLVLRGVDAQADHARALRVLGWLAPAPLVVSRAIARHVLEAVAAERPTLLIDDQDGGTLYRRDMRAALAAGALCDGQFLVARSRRHPSGCMPCFAPAAIATTMTLPADLRLRSIVVPMTPAAAAVRRGPALGLPPVEVLRLRAELAAFADQAGPKFSITRVSAGAAALPRHVAGPVKDNWATLLAIAQLLGKDVAARAVVAAVTLAEADVAPTSNLALLADIRAVVPLDDAVGITTVALLDKLTAEAELPWARIRRGARLDARELADRLRAFGVRPATLRLAQDSFARGYRNADLRAAFDQYLPEAALVREGEGDGCDGNVSAA